MVPDSPGRENYELTPTRNKNASQETETEGLLNAAKNADSVIIQMMWFFSHHFIWRERERERSLWTMNAETPECHFMSLLDSPSKLSQLFQVNSQWQAGARCFLSMHLRILSSATVWWSQGGNNIYSPYIPHPESSLQKGLRKFLALLLRTITPDCVGNTEPFMYFFQPNHLKETVIWSQA